MIGLQIPGVLVYDHPNTMLQCAESEILDIVVNWQHGGYPATYQCVQGQNGEENYCRRRSTNGPISVPGVFGAWRPRVGPSDLYTSCEVCNLACSGKIPKP